VTNLITPRTLFSPVLLPYNQTWSRSDDPFRRYGHLQFSKMAASRHLVFGPTGSRSIWSAIPENTTLGSNTKSIGWSVAEIWPFEIFPKMVASRHLGFGETGNSAIRSAVPENPTLEPNMKWIGWPVAEIWPFESLQNARSVSRSVGPQYYTLFSYTPLHYVRNVVREE